VVLLVAAAVVAAVAGTWILSPTSSKASSKAKDKTLQWEYLRGESGTDLQRLKTPQGWIVEGADGYLVVMSDPDHEWLADDEEDSRLDLFDDTRCAK
jgi:hypothetical protein